ncbi:MAG: DUF4442 domain-containing protein [Chitinophagaceae bacterium]|nr:MAG: DUF4442 domain-containing protein [Chitinophagaceae bacterium]
MEAGFQIFKSLITHSFKSKWFLLTQLPSAFFSGVRVRKIDEDRCEVSVPHQWFSKNPFRSTYFACLGMAAEMSTGALSLGHLFKKSPAVSMLVVHSTAEFFKKATDVTTFICVDGLLLKKTIEEAISSGESKSVAVKSVGKNVAGEVIAQFQFTWSFKVKG